MRAIARTLRVSRNTVTDVIQTLNRQRRGLSCDRTRPARSAKLAPFEATIQRILMQRPNVKIVQLLDELRAQGYSGSYTILRQRVKDLRHSTEVEKSCTASQAPARIRFHSLAFQSTRTGRQITHLFTFRFIDSNHTYLRFTPACDFITTLYEHVRVFEWLGRVPTAIEYRDVTSIVSQNDSEPTVKLAFLRFATHYGFRPVLNHFTDDAYETALLQRLDRELLRSHRFRSIDHLNDAMVVWLGTEACRRGTVGDRDSIDPSSTSTDALSLVSLPECTWDG